MEDTPISTVILEEAQAGLRALALHSDGSLAALHEGPASEICGWCDALRDKGALRTVEAMPDRVSPRAIPCPPLPEALPEPGPGGAILLPGLRQKTPIEDVSPAMALRLGGLLAADPEFDGVACLTGPQGLWAHLSAGEVVSVLRVASTTAHAALNGPSPPAAPDAGFDTALSDCLSRPERLLRFLGSPGHDAAAQAGAIIGAELAAAKPWWLGQRVRVLGHDGWPALYAHALEIQGVPVVAGDGDAALIAGLSALSQRGA